MAKRIASSVYNNINDFPDEVLCHIISLLSIKEAVRTSILSTRWRHLFTLLSNLDLDMDTDDEQERKCLMKFVLYPGISSILRFRFQCRQYTDPLGVSLWIRAVEGHESQELDLQFNSRISDGLGLLQNLFSCQSLVVLKVSMSRETYELKIPTRICLLHVKVLHFHAIVFPNDGTEEQLFSSCPTLEDLVLDGCVFSRGCVKFSVSNQNLKRLMLECISSREKKPVDILINAPNLIFLSYSISGDYSLEFVDVKYLATAVIDSNKSASHGSGYHIVASGALRHIQNIQTLEITYAVLRVLQRNKVSIPLLDKLKCLKLQDWECPFNSIYLEYILARCVVLETLVFEESSSQSALQNTRTRYSMQDSVMVPLLLHLKTIEFKLFDIVQAKAFIVVMGFFMGNARVLEQLKIYTKQCCPLECMKIIKRLGLFRRVSNRCRVCFER